VKQKISISFIAVSVIFLLALIILPHHHHEGLACIVMEVCEQDNKVNDEHTHHSDTPDEEHNETCIAETEYIAPLFKGESKCKISSCKDSIKPSLIHKRIKIIQGKRTKILSLRHAINTGIYIRVRRYSDREKVFTQVIRYIIDRSLYLFE
jgi:hypothetical protein